MPGYRSDHSMITLTLEFGKKIIHRGLWKHNASLLKDENYVNEINNEITNVTKEYAKEQFNDDANANIETAITLIWDS